MRAFRVHRSMVVDVGDPATAPRVLGLDGLDGLIAALAAQGHRVIGPTVRDGAIVYDEIDGVADLPGRLDGGAGGRHLPARAA